MVVIYDSNLAYSTNFEIKNICNSSNDINNHVANENAVCLWKYFTDKSVIRYVCRYDMYVCMKVSCLKKLI